MRFLECALQRALGNPTLRIEQEAAVSGGCIHQARRLATSAGEFFAKWSAESPEDIFLREAEGLEALRSAGSQIVIPRVIAASAPVAGDPAFLILEYLEPAARGGQSDDERLGRGLALVHRSRHQRHGFPSATYCGSTRQDNRWCDSWLEFYRDRRIEPLVEALDRQGQLSPADRRSYTRLANRLPELLPHEDAPPSLIHGDLWSGNVLSTAAGPALVDPSCAYADREMEFGITTLFGGLSERAFAAYQEAWPLPPEWRERNPLYQLYHLLNHAVLFGGHYRDEARRVAARFTG
jgi:protein-ribulosamine 3-kinase